jgi:deoxyribose-phosphate aldolase
MTLDAAITRAELARMIDDTLLEPEATDEYVVRLAKEASQWGTWSICISPSRLPLAPGTLAPGTTVVAVVGFPSGAHPVAVKAAEAAAAVAAGAREIDMVIDLGAATGFHPAGGATVPAVAAIAAAVGGRLRVKASGGIRTADEALAMIAAGATRIGTSHTAAILNGVPSE